MMKSLGKINRRRAILYSVFILSILIGFFGVYQADQTFKKHEYDFSYYEYVIPFLVPCFLVQYILVLLGWVYNRFIQKDESKKFVFFFYVGKGFSILNAVVVAFVFFAITMSYSNGQEAQGRDFAEYAMELYYWEIIIPWIALFYMTFFYIEGGLIFLWQSFRKYVVNRL